MGITTEEFFQKVYSVMFSPKNFFEIESENNNFSTRLAIGIVSVMAVINKFAHAIADNAIDGFSFIFTLIWGVICALIMWLVVALFIEYVAKIFDRSSRLQKFLYLSAFASIPSLFFIPISLLKNLGETGYIISVVLSCLLYIWVIFLYAYAIKTTYLTTLARAFMLIFLPIISFILAIYQIVGFYYKMSYIFSL